MGLKINNFFLLIIFIMLQSCSGGRIGDFLESSFQNIEEPKIKAVINNNLKNKIDIKSEGNAEINKNVKEPKIKEDVNTDLKNKLVLKSEGNVEKNKIDKQNMFQQKKQYQPQSYKIIIILKDVDPKDPTKDLNTILRNSEVNFEIEKIERFVDSKIKSIKN